MFPEQWKKKQEGSTVVYRDKAMDHPRNDVKLTIVTSLAHDVSYGCTDKQNCYQAFEQNFLCLGPKASDCSTVNVIFQ